MSSLDTTSPPCQYPDPVPGLIPFGSVSLLSGASGAGKTLLKASWFRAWLDGLPILGYPTNKPVGLYYLAADRPWHPTYADTFAHVNLTRADLHWYALLDDPEYDPRVYQHKHAPSASDFLAACFAKLAPVPGSVVNIDPLAPLFVQGDQNRAKDVALSLHWVRKLTAQYQCTTLCDANIAKLKADDDFKRPQDRISGSGAFLAYSDTQFNLTQDGPGPDDTRTLIWQPRRAPEGEQKYKFDVQTKLLVPVEGDEGPTAATDKPSQLLTLFPPADQSITTADLCDAAEVALKMDRRAVHRALVKLLKRGEIEHDIWGEYRRRKLN